MAMCQVPSHGEVSRVKIRSRPSSSMDSAFDDRLYVTVRPSFVDSNQPSLRKRVMTVRAASGLTPNGSNTTDRALVAAKTSLLTAACRLAETNCRHLPLEF